MTPEGTGTRVAWIPGADAYFSASGTSTVTVSGTLNVGNIVFSGSGYTLAGTGTLNLVNPGATITALQDASIGAKLSGSYGLIKDGSGTLSLSAANTYTGTTTISGGVLQVGNGGSSGSLASASIVDNGILTFNRSGSQTYSGIVSGTGSVNLQGGGVFTFSGANSYSGGTTIAASTSLQLNNGSAIGDITDNGTLTFNRTDTYTYSGSISGSGNVIKSGSGTITLSGSSSYSGGTTITAGVLAVSANNNLGASSGSLTFTGGTLQFASGSGFDITSLRPVTLASGTGTFDTNGNDITFGGAISGSGALAKVGAGTLTLSGNSTYSGGATLSGGITVGSDSALGSGPVFVSGPVTLQASGGDRIISNNITLSGDLTVQGSNSLTITGSLTNSGAAAHTLTNSLSAPASVNLGNVYLAESDSYSRTLKIAGSGSTVINGVIANNAAGNTVPSNLKINADGGMGTLTFNSANTYSGTTTFTAGTLNLYAAGAIGGGELDVGGNISGADTTFYLNEVPYGLSGTAAVCKLAGQSTLTLSVPNDYSGGTSTVHGTLAINDRAAIGTGPLVIGTSNKLDNTSGHAITLSTNNAIFFPNAFHFVGSQDLNLGTGPVTLAGNASDAQVTVDAGVLTVGGSISGSGGLSVVGAGALELAGTNTYSGPTTIQDGTLRLNAEGGYAVPGDLVYSGIGRLQLMRGEEDGGSPQLPPSDILAFNSGGTLDLQGHTLTVAGLQSARNINSFIESNGGSGTLIVNNAADCTFMGDLRDYDTQLGQLSLVKTGAGQLTLATVQDPLGGYSCLNSYSGTTTISGGKLQLGDASGHAGALYADSTAWAGGVVGSGSFAVALNGDTAQSGYGQLSVNGTVTLTGSTLSLGGTRSNNDGQSLVILANDGTDAIVGTFAGLPEGATVTGNGVSYTITYAGGDGNDVALVDQTPVVTMSGPASGNEGDTLTYDASATGTNPTDTLTYTWSVKKGGSPYTLPEGTVSDDNTFTFAPDDNGSYEIDLEVGGVQTLAPAPITLTINNVAPTAELIDDGPVLEGSLVTVSFDHVLDSPADTSAGFRYSFAQSEDDLATSYADAGTSDSATFVQGATLTVYGRIFDKEGDYSDLSSELVAQPAGPTDISLSSRSISEEAAVGTIVARLSAQDLTSQDLSFALVTGDGADDNAAFTIDNNLLKTATPFNYETKNTYSIRIRVTDGDSRSYECALTIGITSGNQAPVIWASWPESQFVRGNTVALTTNASDDTDEANLTYTWTVTGTPPGAVTFSSNGLNSSQDTTATFSSVGSYVFQVTVMDDGSLTAVDTLTVEVQPVASTVSVWPALSSVEDGATCQFSATAYDQFGQSMDTQWGFDWNVEDASMGTIDYDGLYTAPGSGTGAVTVSASTDSVRGEAPITITVPLPPAAPTGLVATAVAAYQIDLSWTDNGTNETGYVLEQATDPNFAHDLQSYDLDAHATSYSATTGVLSNVTYYFRVRAVNAGGASLNSNVASDVTPLVPQVPSAPAGLAVSGRAANEIDLSWTDVKPNSYGVDETSYQLERASDADFTENVTRFDVAPDATSYSDTGLEADATYYYRLRAVCDYGWSNASEAVSAMAPSAAEIPSLAAPASAADATVTATSTALSVLGTDDGGEGNLTYHWLATAIPHGAQSPSFSGANNGTHAAKNITVTFTQAGTYSFLVSITDADGLSTSSSVTVQVDQTLSGLSLTPGTASVSDGACQWFFAMAQDQFGKLIAQSPSLTWSVSGAGSIAGSGLYAAPASGDGSATVRVSSGDVNADVTLSYTSAGGGHAAADTMVLPNQGGAITLDVLANDNSGLSIISITQPAHGTVTLVNGVLSYLPSSGFAGTDSFSYTAEDGDSNSYSVPVSLNVFSPAAPVISEGDDPGVLLYHLSTGFLVDATHPFFPGVLGNYIFTCTAPTDTTASPWSDDNGIAHSVTTTVDQTLTVTSTVSRSGGWTYFENLHRVTGNDTAPVSGDSGTHQSETLTDTYTFSSSGDGSTSGYIFTAGQTDELSGSSSDGDGASFTWSLSGYNTLTTTNSTDLETGSVTSSSDQYGDPEYTSSGTAPYHYDTDGGRVTGTSSQNSHWDDSWHYVDGVGSYVYHSSDGWSYSGSGSYSTSASAGSITERGSGGSSTTYVMNSAFSGGTWVKTGSYTGGDSSSGDYSSSGSGSYTHATTDAKGSSTVSGTTGVSHSVNWGSSDTWGTTLGADGNWSSSSGHGDSTGTTQDSWSYSGNGTYSDTSSGLSGTIKEGQTNGSRSSYSIHTDWSGSSLTSKGNSSASDSVTGNWSSTGTGRYTHTTVNSSGSSTVSGTTGATHVLNWGSSDSVSLALGSGTWTTTSGGGNSTGTTQDTWSYSGNGTYSDTTSGLRGTIDEAQTNTSRSSYNISTNWSGGTWVPSGTTSASDTVHGHWNSSGSGTYVHSTSGATGSYISGTLTAAHNSNWDSADSIASSLGTSGNWAITSGHGDYTANSSDTWGYGGSRGLLWSSSTSGSSQGTFNENGNNTSAAGATLHLTWQNGYWSLSGNSSVSAAETGHWDSSSTGSYTHTTGNDTEGSSVSGTTGAKHSVDWHGDSSLSLTASTPAPVGSAAPTATWALSSGQGNSTTTTKDDWNYGSTAGKIWTSDGSKGTIHENGSNSASVGATLHSTWENSYWNLTGNSSVFTSETGHWDSSLGNSYSHTTTTSTGGSNVAGTTSAAHVVDWHNEASLDLKVSTPAPVGSAAATATLSISGGRSSSTTTAQDNWGYQGTGTYTDTNVAGTIREGDAGRYTTGYTVSSTWAKKKWNYTGKQTTLSADAGSWVAQGTGTYSNPSQTGTTAGSTSVTRNVAWHQHFESTKTLDASGNSWSMQSGYGDNTNATKDDWGYIGSGSYNDGATSGTIAEHGNNGLTNTYSTHDQWDVSQNKWIKRGEKADTSLDQGHWSASGSGTYVPYCGYPHVSGSTNVTKSNDWSYWTSTGQTWDPGAGTSGDWVTHSGITSSSTSSLSSTSSSAEGTYGRVLPSFWLDYGFREDGWASQTTAGLTSSSYSWSDTLCDGDYSYSGSGHAQENSDYSLTFHGGGTVSYTYSQGDYSSSVWGENPMYFTEAGASNLDVATGTDWTRGADGSWWAASTTNTASGVAAFSNTGDLTSTICGTQSGFTMNSRKEAYDWGGGCNYGFSRHSTVTRDEAGHVSTSGTASGGGFENGFQTFILKQYFLGGDGETDFTTNAFNYTEDWTQDFATSSNIFNGENVATFGDETLYRETLEPNPDLTTVISSSPEFGADYPFIRGYSPSFSVLNTDGGFGYDESLPSLFPVGTAPTAATPCFAAGTQVVTSVDESGQETTKNIEDIKEGDTVLTRDQNNPDAPLEERQVTAVEVHTVASLRLLIVQEADGSTETLRTTDEHPFWVISDSSLGEGGSWVKAQDLKAGDQLLTPDGRQATVTDTQTEAHPEGITVYNLTVEGDHTFFVASASGDEAVWVHNDNPTNADGHQKPVTPAATTPPSRSSAPTAFEGLTFSVGTQVAYAGYLRDWYVRQAAKLTSESTGMTNEQLKSLRDALKQATRAKQNELAAAIVREELARRAVAGQAPRFNNPSKTNPGLNRLGTTMKVVGGVMVFVTLADEVHTVMTAPPGSKAIEAARATGRLGGAFLLGKLGATIGSVGGPAGVIVGGAIGGGIGAIGGQDLVDAIRAIPLIPELAHPADGSPASYVPQLKMDMFQFDDSPSVQRRRDREADEWTRRHMYDPEVAKYMNP